MSALLHLVRKTVTQRDVEVAWATHRALLLAKVDDPKLANDIAHQEATAEARDRFLRLFDEWSKQC